jgi:hypothetical protein
MPDNHLETLLLYAAGELTPGKAAEFETHLASCEECRIGLQTAQKAHEWAKIAEEEPSPELFAAVLSRSEKHRTRTIFGKNPFRWGIAMTTAAALAVALLILRPARQESYRETTLPMPRPPELENKVQPPENAQETENLNRTGRKNEIQIPHVVTFEYPRPFRHVRRTDSIDIPRISRSYRLNLMRPSLQRAGFQPEGIAGKQPFKSRAFIRPSDQKAPGNDS